MESSKPPFQVYRDKMIKINTEYEKYEIPSDEDSRWKWKTVSQWREYSTYKNSLVFIQRNKIPFSDLMIMWN